MNAKNRKRRSVEKPLCKYGVSCYQKNQEHRKKFKHPPKNDMVENRNSLDDATDRITPETSVTGASIQGQNNAVDCLKIEETVGEILKSMPKDFFDFWDFCTHLNKSHPEDAFSDIGYKLVGVYDVLAKKLPTGMKVDISCHWRYFYDPPEFQTVIRKAGRHLYHIGYFRDYPDEMPFILACNSAADGEKLALMGDNIFGAMNVELTTILDAPKSKVSKTTVKKLQESLLKFASQKKYSLDRQTSKTKERQKKVVAKTFHGLGIVVPLQNDVGYRPLPCSNAELKKILKKIASAENETERIEKEEDLDNITSNVNFANDECDYGMGFEFGIDLFCFGDPYLHNILSFFLPLAYNLLERPRYALIVKAHLKNRKKDPILSTFDV